VNIDEGGGPESVEPAESSVESGEVDGKVSSTFMRGKESPPCVGPSVGSVKSEEKLCALDDSDEKLDDSGSDGYIVGLAVP